MKIMSWVAAFFLGVAGCVLMAQHVHWAVVVGVLLIVWSSNIAEDLDP